jgi:hypothetical protein
MQGGNMDVTIDTALKIISNPSVSAWRKVYWTKLVKDEVSGYRVAKLYSQAEMLEKRLNSVLLKKAL